MNGSDGTSVVQLVSDVVSPEAKSIVSPTSDLGTDDISVIINAGVVSLISDIVGVGTGDGCAAFWVISFLFAKKCSLRDMTCRALEFLRFSSATSSCCRAGTALIFFM